MSNLLNKPNIRNPLQIVKKAVQAVVLGIKSKGKKKSDSKPGAVDDNATKRAKKANEEKKKKVNALTIPQKPKK